jgi:hypothetical protein
MADSAREHLEAVHAELEEAAAAGEEGAGDLSGQVGAYLGTETPSAEDDEHLIERLNDGVRRWEATHPKLSRTLQGVIDSLTASGI